MDQRRIEYVIDGIKKEVPIDSRSDYEYICMATYDSTLNKSNQIAHNLLMGKEKHGLPLSEAYRRKIYDDAENIFIAHSEFVSKINSRRERLYSEVMEATGMTRFEIDERIAVLNQNPYASIGIEQYAQSKLYEASGSAVEKLFQAIHRRKELSKVIKPMFVQIDEGNDTYDNLSPYIDEYYELTRLTLMDTEKESLNEEIEKSAPFLFNDEMLLEKVYVDLLVCRRLMGFTAHEYFVYKFQEKNLEEKRGFLSLKERKFKMRDLNDRSKNMYLSNKYLAYTVLKKFYKREIVDIKDMNDAPVFQEYIKGKTRFVFKPTFGSMGRGIELVEIPENVEINSFMEELFEKSGPGGFVAEDLIIAHECLKRLNPDSVNTLRIASYYDGEKAKVILPSLRVGRKGFFVDNGAVGGIFVAIDVETGKLFSNGVDMYGNELTHHPDTGIEFKGYQIEYWPQAKKLVEELSVELATKVEGINFVGWDITLTADNEWVIVEGNMFPQMFLQQAVYGNKLKTEWNSMFNRKGE